ncbi:hypothetical protein ANCCAN_12618 [Ancylostoma caninum]|uniref:G-protein coupled receptors family 1 profile domain-containing protein n=1 Tax=Ancylostoma caninum TaxID=29170 RepID=A0A368GEI7_ANCCA|nr:hypothetical protein ANCCAN_12618 [Ancylostoma caninum]
MVILMESFFMGSFWSAMVSYVALSVLKLFAVWRPFHYRKWFTMKRCINLIVFSWVVFILMISYTLGVSALVKIPALNEWSGCKMETCARAMYRSRNVVTIFVYFFTLVVFVITVLLIRRAQRFVDSFKKRDSSTSEGGRRVRFPLWKLALNVATFAGFYLFYVIWCIGMLLNKDQCLCVSATLWIKQPFQGFDQLVNVVLEDSHERVYSESQGVEQIPLGLYIIRGDNM